MIEPQEVLAAEAEAATLPDPVGVGEGLAIATQSFGSLDPAHAYILAAVVVALILKSPDIVRAWRGQDRRKVNGNGASNPTHGGSHHPHGSVEQLLYSRLGDMETKIFRAMADNKAEADADNKALREEMNNRFNELTRIIGGRRDE